MKVIQSIISALHINVLIFQISQLLNKRWDNGSIPKGEKRSNLVGLNDIYATLCHLTEVTVPNDQGLDSISFKENIYDESKDTRETLGAWTYQNKSLRYESIRQNELKLIRNYQTKEVYLYNLTSDISESIDISIGNEDLIQKLFASLETFGPCYDKKGRFIALMKPDGKKVKRVCSWFRKKNTKTRCKKYPNAQTHCRAACALENSRYCSITVE